MSKLIFLFLFSGMVMASSKGYCFKQDTSLDIVKAVLSPVKLPKDEVEYLTKSHCIQIEAEPHRLELLERVLYQHFTIVGTLGGTIKSQTSSQDIVHCKFKLEEQLQSDKKEKNVSVGDKNVIGRRRDRKSRNTITSIMVIANRYASIQMGENQAYMKCIPKGSIYDVEFSLSSEEGGLSSTISLARGQKIEVGSVVQDLDDKQRQVGIPKGVQYTKITGFENKKYFLSIKN